jgi:hypothetical protein
MPEVVPCHPYTCVKSPVEWIAIDVLAIITVVWIIFTFLYKGVRGRNVMRYPQIHMMIPYPEWEKKLLAEKPAMGAGRVVAAFFKTLFVDVLAMGILKCEYGRSEREVVRTRTAKRAAKLLMVWGFVFAGISTALAYLMFPHDKIVLDLHHPARIFGMLGGVLMIIGALMWLSVRYKEAGYSGRRWWDLIGADYLPIMVLLLGVSGFALQAAILAWAYGWSGAEVLILATHFHAVPVAAFFWLFFWTKADHIVYRIFWRIYDYADKELAGPNTRLPPTTLKPLNKTGKEIQPGY